MGRKVNQDHKIRSLVLNRVVKWMFFLLNKVRVWRPRGTHLYPNFPLVPLMHASLYMYLREFSIRAGGRRFTWTRRLLFFGNYPSLNRVFTRCNRIKKSELMMSVFCSHPLIFAPEWWKCILRGPVSFFPRNLRSQVAPLPRVFFLLYLLQSFCQLLKIVLKPCSWAAF